MLMSILARRKLRAADTLSSGWFQSWLVCSRGGQRRLRHGANDRPKGSGMSRAFSAALPVTNGSSGAAPGCYEPCFGAQRVRLGCRLGSAQYERGSINTSWVGFENLPDAQWL